MNSYEVIPARKESDEAASDLMPARPTAGEGTRRGGISAVTVVVIAAAVCIALLAFVNLAYAGETDVLQGVETLARVS